MYNNSLFWFRQDLRTFDNNGLIKAINSSRNLITIFVLDKNIIDDFLGLSDKKFLFIKEALLNLDFKLKKLGGKLIIYYDKPEDIIPEIIKKYSIEAVFTNKSYSKYGKKRDSIIENFCIENNIDFFAENDFLLVEPEDVEQRKLFTPYYKIWKNKIKEIELQIPNNFNQIETIFDIKSFLDLLIIGEKHPYFTIEFGRKKIDNFHFENYDLFRNDLDKDGTSRLSIYIRFGIFSIREVRKKTKNLSESYVRELAWRDFWQHIDYYFPFTKQFEFQKKRRKIEWKHDKKLFEKWCKGETGYPVVDACIKQLLETNWMHGRGRMIVASFLTKDLLIDWRRGEAFFKKHLLDYDENINFGNWQWSASVGADPKPLRIFNPSLQSEKFDKEAKFIKKYISELKDEEIKKIHNPLDNKLNYFDTIIDHRIAQKITKEEFKK